MLPAGLDGECISSTISILRPKLFLVRNYSLYFDLFIFENCRSKDKDTNYIM